MRGPSDATPQGGAREVKKTIASEPAAAPPAQETGTRAPALHPETSPACAFKVTFFCVPLPEPVVQFNTWVGSDSPHTSLPVVHSPRPGEQPIFLEDVQTDEDKLNGSLLSSESTFIPFTSDLEPQTNQTDSEDETETFELDSLAPKRPPPPRKPNTNKMYNSPPEEKQERKTLEEEATAAVSPDVRVSTSQTDLEAASNAGKAESKEAPEQEDAAMCASRSALMEADKAAVKIQSWWRGQHTRCCHPMAREVRSEIRLRRMQEHIVFLSEKLGRSVAES